MINLISEIDNTVAHLFAQIQMIESCCMDGDSKFATIEAAMYHSNMHRTLMECLRTRNQIVEKQNNVRPTGIEAIQAFMNEHRMTDAALLAKAKEITNDWGKVTHGNEVYAPALPPYFTLDNPIGRTSEVLTQPEKPRVKRKYTKRTNIQPKKTRRKK